MSLPVLQLLSILSLPMAVILVSLPPFPQFLPASNPARKNFATWMPTMGTCANKNNPVNTGPKSMNLGSGLGKVLHSMGVDMPSNNIIPGDRVVYNEPNARIFRTHLCGDDPSKNYVVKIIEAKWFQAKGGSTGASYVLCFQTGPLSLDTAEPVPQMIVTEQQNLMMIEYGQINCPNSQPVQMVIDAFMPWVLSQLGYDRYIKKLKGCRLYDEGMSKEWMILISDYLEDSAWVTLLDFWTKTPVPAARVKLSLQSLITLGCNLDEDSIFFGDAHWNNFMVDVNTGQIKLIDFGGFFYGQTQADRLTQTYRSSSCAPCQSMKKPKARISNIYLLAHWTKRIALMINQPEVKNMYTKWGLVVDRELAYPGSTCDLLHGVEHVKDPASNIQAAVTFLNELYADVLFTPHPVLPNKRRKRAWPKAFSSEIFTSPKTTKSSTKVHHNTPTLPRPKSTANVFGQLQPQQQSNGQHQIDTSFYIMLQFGLIVLINFAKSADLI